MIREATHRDIPHLVEMGGKFIRSSTYYSRLADNPQARKDLLKRLIESSDGEVFVSERDGCITGMIGVAAYVHPWAGEYVAGEVFWWVDPAERGHGVRLLKRAEEWMDAKGCTRAQMVAPNERVAKVYERLGYVKLEECWQKDL